MMPLDGTLVTGDIVNIKTNKNSLGPSEDWLKFVKSQHARHRIRAFLNQKNEDSLKQTGKEELLAELESNKLTLNLITPEFINKYLSIHHVNSLDSLFYEIGKDIISVKTIVNLLAPEKNQSQENLVKQMEKTNRLLHIVSETGVYVDGLDNPQIKLASCCNPLPGDKLVGYISKTAGIIAHLDRCPNLKTLDEKRFIDLEWLPKITRKYPCWLRILTNTHPNALNDVITAINSLGISIAEFKSTSTSSLETLIKVKVLLVNTVSLDLLIMNIKKIERVYLVERGTL
jgi:GTP pyrophosphokinase